MSVNWSTWKAVEPGSLDRVGEDAVFLHHRTTQGALPVSAKTASILDLAAAPLTLSLTGFGRAREARVTFSGPCVSNWGAGFGALVLTA